MSDQLTAAEAVRAATTEPVSEPCAPSCWTSVTCTMCDRRKQPIGRSMPLGAYYCGPDCSGYRSDPFPPHLFDEHDSTRYFSDPDGWAAHERTCETCRD